MQPSKPLDPRLRMHAVHKLLGDYDAAQQALKSR
jgi:hypothetical protein